MNYKKLLLVGLLLSISPQSFAKQKQIECEVSVFHTGKELGFGWTYREGKAELNPEIKKFSELEYAEATGVINLNDGFQVVFDVRWDSGIIGNDDISVIQKPHLSATARVQKKLSDGQIQIVAMGEQATGYIGYDAPVTRKIFVEQHLENTPAYSKALAESGNPTMSVNDLKRLKFDSKEPLIFGFACNTGI